MHFNKIIKLSASMKLYPSAKITMENGGKIWNHTSGKGLTHRIYKEKDLKTQQEK